MHYHATVTENIALSHGGLDHKTERAAKPHAVSVQAAAHAVGAEAMITQLPRGYDTLLGKWFDEGTELSGGQWQRLALARACWRPAPIILLDEPTSAMDPERSGLDGALSHHAGPHGHHHHPPDDHRDAGGHHPCDATRTHCRIR